VHDFEPGIKPSGLFWTIPVSDSAIDVDPGAGRARLRAANLAVPDFGNFGNAISPSPTSVPGHASFDVRWDGSGSPTRIRDTTFDFAGRFIGGNATIRFVVADDGSGVVYTSDAAGQTTVSAGVGRERNGIFFVNGDDGEASR
jgi:hypothetical protein